MNLTNRLKELRLKKELSQQELADMVGCSRQTIISIESNCKNPSVELALKLSVALALSVNELFALEEGKEKDKFCKRIADLFRCRS
jgi:putative transcriptional regulator